MWIQNLMFSLFGLSLAATALGQSHAMIDRNRSSWQNNIFLTQSIEGEYGSFETKASDSDAVSHKTWRGYGIRNGVGMEAFKFIQFSLSHTMFHQNAKSSSLENARGSRLAADLGLVFSAPIANIQFNAGLTAAEMDYQKGDENAAYSGTGRYLGLGLTYFFSPRLSLQALGKQMSSFYAKDGGNLAQDRIETKMENFSLGLSVWL